MGDKVLLSTKHLNVTRRQKVGTLLCGTLFYCIVDWTFGLLAEFKNLL